MRGCEPVSPSRKSTYFLELTVRVPSGISTTPTSAIHLDDELSPAASRPPRNGRQPDRGPSVFSLSFPRGARLRTGLVQRPAVLPAYVVLAVCLTTTKSLSAQTIATVQITPTNVTLPAGTCQQFLGWAYDAAGKRVLSAALVYSLSNLTDFTLRARNNGYVCSNATLAAGSTTKVKVTVSGTQVSTTTTFTVPPAPGAQVPPPGDMSISRDLVLERAALAQRNKIDSMLSPSAKLKLNSVSEAFLNRLLRDNNDVDPSQLVKEELERQFVQLSSQQSDLLTFYTLAGVVELIPPHSAGRDERQGGDSGLSEEAMLRLQQYMDKRSKFEQTLSNQMKKASETTQGIIQNLK